MNRLRLMIVLHEAVLQRLLLLGEIADVIAREGADQPVDVLIVDAHPNPGLFRVQLGKLELLPGKAAGVLCGMELDLVALVG